MVSAHEVERTKGHGGGSGVFVALIPWVLFTLVAQHGTLKLASVAALVVSIAICAPGVIAGKPKMLELGAVAAFGAFVIVAFAGDPSLGAWVDRYARGIAAALLAIIAFGSLATVPFTEQYAREQVPQEAWSSPRFKEVNRRLTVMWGTVFAAMVPFHIAAGAINTRPTNVLFNWIVPVGLVLWAIKHTSDVTNEEQREQTA